MCAAAQISWHSSIGAQARKSGPESHKTCGCGSLAAPKKGGLHDQDQETIKQLVDLIERFVRERLVPNEERLATEGRLPDDILEEMKALGLFGLTIPEEYGGLGLTMEEEILVSIALGRTSPLFAPSWARTTASALQQ